MKHYLLIISFLILCTPLYAQEPVNTLNRVNISSDAYGIDINFDFNGPVSFTSMKLPNPPRIVLDFTDCKKGGSVKNSIKVESDGIKEVSFTQMGSSDAPILRATIVTATELDFNIEPTDNGISVKIAGVKLASTAEPQDMTEVKPQNQEVAKPEAKPEPQPSPIVAEEKPEVKPEPQPSPVVAEVKPEAKPEPQPSPVVSEAKPEAKPEPQPAPVVAEVKPEAKPEPQPSPVVAEAKPEAKPEPQPSPVVSEAKPEAKPEPQPAPVVAEAKPEAKPEPQPSPVVSEAKPEPKPEPQPSPVVSEAKPEAKPEPQPSPVVSEVKPEAKPKPAKEEKKPKFKPAPARIASSEDIRKEKEEAQHIETPRKKSSSGRNALTWIGFQMSANGSRIFVKTREEAEYTIKEKDDKTLVLEIYNTDIPKKNNRRPLDTSYFNSPVAYISPQLENGPMKVVKIEIKLKQRVPFITKQEANALYVDFEGAR
jgi:hypothetical protein